MPEQGLLDLPGHIAPPAYALHVPTATSPQTTVPADISSLLPDHLRLTSTNWAAYKRSIPVLCELRRVLHHLRPSDPALALEDKWREEETVCKAIILFNIKEGSHLTVGSSLGRA